jgi:hypothetical protein
MKLSDFRALIPSWLFFDDISAGCQVFTRNSYSVESLGEWKAFLEPRPRRFWHLFLNSYGNLRLFANSTFERLLSESQDLLAEPQAIRKSESYDSCRKLVCALSGVQLGNFYQFKIRSRLDDNVSSEYQDAFMSEIHRV